MQLIEDGSSYPNEYTWDYRQEKFRRFEGVALGDHTQASHPQKEALLREMEQTFCAGAWIATIFLAWSIIDIQLSYIGYPRKGTNRADALSKYINFDALEELRIFRNAVLHRSPEQTPVVDEWEMIFASEAIREKAILAVSLALRVAFICTKYPELDKAREPSD
tara:strand:- start:16 stop:507 length:492 start_codon:yes stop_codon:yes gene_type:complete